MKRRKRFSYDIEVTPDVGIFWQPSHNTTITYDQILQERQIITISLKDEINKKIFHFVWDKPKDLKDFIFGRDDRDKKIIKQFAKLTNSCEEIELVAHNGDEFDLKWIRGRAIKFGIDLSKNIITHDTLKIARQKFRFNSNRLDYLAQYLGVGGKIKTGGLELWKQVIAGDDNALKKMVRYCDNDVKILDDVWKILKPYAKHKTSVTDNRIKCPECGGDTRRDGIRTRATGVKLVELKCKQCGKYNAIPLKIFNKLNKNIWK